MKTRKIIVLFGLIALPLFNGCLSVQPPLYRVISGMIDLREFEDNGIFATTGDHCFQAYKTIGIVSVVCYEGYLPVVLQEKRETATEERGTTVDDMYFNPPRTSTRPGYRAKLCLTEDLIPEMISELNNIGANGLIRLRITQVFSAGPHNQNGIEISGLAVFIE